jgi:hypothetical protein
MDSNFVLSRYSTAHIEQFPHSGTEEQFEILQQACQIRTRKNLQSDNKAHLYLTMETRLKVHLPREDGELTITGEAGYSF